MIILLAIAAAVTALAHMWSAPFVIDWTAGDTAVWTMPRAETPTVYLTYDDGPNPSTTPDTDTAPVEPVVTQPRCLREWRSARDGSAN